MEIDTQATEYSDIALRPIHCKLDALTRSDGSAMLTQGNRFGLFSSLNLEKCSS